FLDSFQIDFDRDIVLERLLSHYLFIAIVDDAIDSGEEGAAPTVFQCFGDGIRQAHEFSRFSDVMIVTEVLKSQIDADHRPQMLRLLRRAHSEVIGESMATSIGEYIKHRKALGRATAKQSYLLIRASLKGPNRKLCRMMEEIGAVGCLIDSVIDLRQD